MLRNKCALTDLGITSWEDHPLLSMVALVNNLMNNSFENAKCWQGRAHAC